MLQNFDHISGKIDRDRRKNDRLITVFHLAKIESGAAEGWGLIKYLSSSGVMIEVHPNFELGDTARVALTDDVELIGSIRWRKGALVGMTQSIILRIGLTLVKAEICDISPAGTRINSRYLCQIGNQLTLLVPDLDDIIGSVRWQKVAEIGTKFQDRVSLPQITDWLASYYSKQKNYRSCESL